MSEQIEIILIDDTVDLDRPAEAQPAPPPRKPVALPEGVHGPPEPPLPKPSPTSPAPSSPGENAPPPTSPPGNVSDGLKDLFGITGAISGTISRVLGEFEKTIGGMLAVPKKVLDSLIPKTKLGGALGGMFGGGKAGLEQLGATLARQISEMEKALVNALVGKKRPKKEKPASGAPGEPVQPSTGQPSTPTTPREKRGTPARNRLARSYRRRRKFDRRKSAVKKVVSDPLRTARVIKQSIAKLFSKSSIGRKVRKGVRGVGRDFKELGASTRRMASSGKKSIVERMERSKVGRSLLSGGRKLSRTARKAGSKVASAGKGVLRKAAGLIPGRSAAAAATAGGAAGSGAGVAGAAAGGAAAGAGGAAVALTGPIGIAVAALVALAAAGLLVMRMFKKQAQELEDYSGAIQGAKAAIEAKRIENRVDRAAKIGPQVAQVEAAKGRFEDAMFDLWTEIFSVLVGLAPLIEITADMATAGLRAGETMINLLQAISNALTLDLAGAVREVGEAEKSAEKFAEAIKDIFQDNSSTLEEHIWNQDPFAKSTKATLTPGVPNPKIKPGNTI